MAHGGEAISESVDDAAAHNMVSEPRAQFNRTTQDHPRKQPFMARQQPPSGRKPATKFAQLRKKMEQNKVRANVKKINVRKSGNR